MSSQFRIGRQWQGGLLSAVRGLSPVRLRPDGSRSVDKDLLEAWLLVGIVLVAAIIRLGTITSRGLWIDEVVTARQALLPIRELLTIFIEGKIYHPPLYHILMHFWLGLFGISEASLRLHSVAWGLGAVVAAYWALRGAGSRSACLIAAGLTAISPFFVWYAQEARMYSIVIFAGFLSTGFLMRALRSNLPWHWVGYAVALLLGLYSHYTFAFLVIGQVVYVAAIELGPELLSQRTAGSWTPRAVFSRVPRLLPWAGALAGSFFGLGLWFFQAVLAPAARSGLNSAGGPTPALRFYDNVRVLLEFVGGFHSSAAMASLVSMWPLFVTILLMGLDAVPVLRRNAMLWFSGLFGILVLMAWANVNGVFTSSRYYAAMIPPLVLLSSVLLSSLDRLKRAPVVVVVTGILLLALASQLLGPRTYMRDGVREIAAEVAQRVEPSDVLLFEHKLGNVWDYYMVDGVPSRPFPRMGDWGRLRDEPQQIQADLARAVAGKNRVWLAISYHELPGSPGPEYDPRPWFVGTGYRAIEQKQVGMTRLILFLPPGSEEADTESDNR